MAIFGRSSPSPQPDSALRLPAQKRLSIPAGVRLSTITEGPQATAQTSRLSAPPPPPASRPTSRNAPSYSTNQSRWSSGNSSRATSRTAPPAYEWMPEPLESHVEDGRAPVEGEKVARLRRGEIAKRRGGWGRLLIIVAIVLVILAIALGVGLGVGLKRHQDSQYSSEISPSQPSEPSTTAPLFPLGEYSIATALREVNTSCTSNSATWRCYPYAIYDSSEANSSIATFNWQIYNTSAIFPTNATTLTTTPSEGVDSNLTISATDNPFALTFSNTSLTYIATSSNATSARLTFSFEISKSVIPSASITSNNAATQCFFNSTTFVGTLYLNATGSFPSAEMADDPGVGGGYTPWPYAVDIEETSPGGQDIPACYLSANGARILTGPAPVEDGGECGCVYRNY